MNLSHTLGLLTWVLVALELALELVQLEGGECGSRAALLPLQREARLNFRVGVCARFYCVIVCQFRVERSSLFRVRAQCFFSLVLL